MAGTPIIDRIAGAPISWGVCEAPGWGYEIASDRVLGEMRELGLRTTELGPTGYLGAQPQDVRDQLGRYDMRLVGGFLPVPMHLDPALDLTEATAAIATLAAGGSEVVVLAARSDDGSYDYKVLMSDEEWTVLLSNLDRLQQVVRDHGMTPTLHPHVGTAIEDRDAVLRLLDSSDILLCLDTGHLLIGGMQPLELLAAAADRVAHVHLKDVNETVAATVAAGDASYLGAVRQGLYTPLGDGDLDIAAIVTALEEIGYQGKYVLEQDCALDGEPEPGQGPLLDVRHSIDFLTSVAS
ncbi:MAG: inosose dehydratase [Pseudonocardiales bacterium]|jgi:inosose dehydratase|nr:inosose dehydratase [Pseudonocardiales bacterium]MDT4957436.1 inosose dehydratase [Pseudonocardiales bacterium]MDT4970421.1 inosose dehydratase [Pseudonocardiales bacterium]